LSIALIYRDTVNRRAGGGLTWSAIPLLCRDAALIAGSPEKSPLSHSREG